MIFFLVSTLLGSIGWSIHHHSYTAGQLKKDSEWKLKLEQLGGANIIAYATSQLDYREEALFRGKGDAEVVNITDTENLAEMQVAIKIACILIDIYEKSVSQAGEISPTGEAVSFKSVCEHVYDAVTRSVD